MDFTLYFDSGLGGGDFFSSTSILVGATGDI